MPSLGSTGPNLNSYAERCVRSVKRGAPRLILFGEQSLRRAVSNFLEHFNQSSGQGQSALIPHRHDCICNSSYRRSLSPAAWWLAQVLQPRRINSLAIWRIGHRFQRNLSLIRPVYVSEAPPAARRATREPSDALPGQTRRYRRGLMLPSRREGRWLRSLQSAQRPATAWSVTRSRGAAVRR